MDLPREIRDHTYAHMMNQSEPKLALSVIRGKSSEWFITAILSTNHQIYEEASAVIYAQRIAIIIQPFREYGCCNIPGKKI